MKPCADQLTKEQAIAFYDSGAWRKMNAAERANFQFAQQLLCMPFGDFHRAVEEALGRPVWTHEFALNRDGLVAELAGKAPAPSLADIMAMLPSDRSVVVALDRLKG